MTGPDDGPAPQGPSNAAALDWERAISPIAGGPTLGRRGKALAVTALAAGVGVFMLATARRPAAHPAQPPAPVRELTPFEPAPPPKARPAALDAPPAAGLASSTPQVPALAQAEGPAADPPLLLEAAHQDAQTIATARPAATPAPAEVAGVPVARAERLPDPTFRILAGTLVPCVLETAIDSTTPGPVRCRLPTDVWSANARLVLLERGSEVIGTYSGLKGGQVRLFVAWTRAVTPAGVAIALQSPAGDPLGRAGLPGQVDSHLWRRFGGAALLTLLDGAAGALGGHGGVSLRIPGQAADTALRSSIDTPPTLTKAAGSEVAILVAQDLDFSGVYSLEPAP